MVTARVIRYDEDRTPRPDGTLIVRAQTLCTDTSFAPGDFEYLRVLVPEVIIDPASASSNTLAFKTAIFNFCTQNGYPYLTFDNIFIPEYTPRSDVTIDIATFQTDNFTGVGVDDARIVRINNTVPGAIITGIADGYQGRWFGIHNIGLAVGWYPEHPGSDPKNRLTFVAPSFLHHTDQTVWVHYSDSLMRWNVVNEPASAVGGLFRVQLAYADGRFTTPDQHGGTIWVWDSVQDALAIGGLRVSRRIQPARGAAVPSDNTLVLGNDGNQFPITVGVWPINGIDVTGWQAGSPIRLELPAAGLFVTAVTNMSGAPGAGAAPVKTRNGLGIIPGLTPYLLDLAYDGTNWVQPN